MKSQHKEPTKKIYTSPQLLVYGDIRELTQGVNPASGTDSVKPAYGTVKTR